MKQYKFLVNCRGFIGDILFASSVAGKLKEQYPICHITYNIPLIQPKLLLERNPYIDKVIVQETPNIHDFDLTVNIPVINQRTPATIQMQNCAGITNSTPGYTVYTVPEYDKPYEEIAEDIHSKGEKLIGWQVNWEYKAYQCTPELLEKRIGAPHRQIDKVIDELWGYRELKLIPCGFDRTISQFDPRAHEPEGFAKTASLIKFCDWFIGSEGGLTNLAAGLGTKVIYTTDYIMQNYGPNGHVAPTQNPQMGPCVYFPNGGHVALDPCIRDGDIAGTIRKIVNA